MNKINLFHFKQLSFWVFCLTIDFFFLCFLFSGNQTSEEEFLKGGLFSFKQLSPNFHLVWVLKSKEIFF